MASNAEPLTTIAFPYYVDHIPRRGRKIRTSWVRGSQSLVIRAGPRSEMKLAFRINRQNKTEDSVIDVYADAHGLWWPIGDGDRSTSISQFFYALKKGHSEALGLLGVGFHVPLKRIVKDIYDLQIRDTHYSSLDDSTARVQIAAQNVRIIDDQHVYVRGGVPVYIFYSSSAMPGKLLADVCNSGFGFGRPVPISIPSDGRFDCVDQMNIKRFIEVGYFCAPDRLGELHGQPVDPARLIHVAKIDCRLPNSSSLDPIELELQLLCRDLIDLLDQKLNMPPGLLRNLEIFQGIGRHRMPTTAECVNALLNFKEWRGTLEEGLWLKFKREDRFVQGRMATIESHCREIGRLPPFRRELDSRDYDALANLGP
jgi:hypothetical protein